MRYLRILLFALLFTSALLAAGHASWDADLVCPLRVVKGVVSTANDTGTFIIDLHTRPLWSPPTVPAYEIFRQTFPELPPKEPSDAISLRIFRYDYTVFILILYAAASSAVSGLLYLFMRRGARDVVLHYALFVAVGYASLMVLCYPLYCWGSEMAFSLIGVGFGFFLSTILWRRQPPASVSPWV